MTLSDHGKYSGVVDIARNGIDEVIRLQTQAKQDTALRGAGGGNNPACKRPAGSSCGHYRSPCAAGGQAMSRPPLRGQDNNNQAAHEAVFSCKKGG